MSEVKSRQLAIDTRLKLGLQSTEHLDVYRAVSSLGITCVKRPLESSISGATLKTDKVKVILINSSKTLGHQNFTIAHEIYHCLYDENLVSKACKTEAFNRATDSEKIADLFAQGAAVARDLKMAHHGDLIVITGGVPIGVPGSTNLLKVEMI